MGEDSSTYLCAILDCEALTHMILRTHMTMTTKEQVQEILSQARTAHGSVRIDLGCGLNRVPGTIGVDHLISDEVQIVANIEETLPFPDQSIDEVYLSHVLEHVHDPWELVKEIHRVLVVGGRCEIRVPHHTNPSAFEMGHRTYWNRFSMTGVLRNGTKSKEQQALFLEERIAIEPLFLRGLLRPVINAVPRLYEMGLCHLFPAYEVVYSLKKQAV